MRTFNEANLNILTETKDVYIKQLNNKLKHLIYEGFFSMYRKSINKNSRKRNDIFLSYLRKVPNWDDNRIQLEIRNNFTKINIDKMDRLIKAVFLTYTKILSSVKVSMSKITDVTIYIPDFKKFIHTCYIQCAREYYKNPSLFDVNCKGLEKQKNIKENLLIVEDAIKQSIENLLPIDDIIQQNLLDSDEESEEEESGEDDESEDESEEEEENIIEDDESEEEYIEPVLSVEQEVELMDNVEPEVEQVKPVVKPNVEFVEKVKPVVEQVVEQVKPVVEPVVEQVEQVEQVEPVVEQVEPVVENVLQEGNGQVDNYVVVEEDNTKIVNIKKESVPKKKKKFKKNKIPKNNKIDNYLDSFSKRNDIKEVSEEKEEKEESLNFFSDAED